MAKNNTTAVSDEEIIAALIQSGTLAQAAQSVHISPRTLYDRMSMREFQAAYSAAKADIIRGAVQNLCCDLQTATQTVREIMLDAEANHSTRLAAAKLIFENALKFSEHLQGLDLKTANYASPAFGLDFDRI